MSQRIHNFNAGPAALPLPVLEQVQAELLNFQDTGMSLLEMSHRSAQFDAVIEDAAAGIKTLLGLGDDFEVLFMTGGASTQFALIPMNLTAGMRPVYINTGTWSTKAIKEAKIQGKDPLVAASSEDRSFAYIPKDYDVPAEAAYLHYTTNNTIKGTQWHTTPQCDAPLIADMSSDILSRPLDVKRFGMIYAGAQKNLGPAGVTVVIIRKDMLERVPADLPTIMKYTTFAEKNSMFNTCPTFPIYIVGLVVKWLTGTFGDLAAVEKFNQEKAAVLYDAMDASNGFYSATADADSRSLMNVTFRLADAELEPVFVAEALKAGFGGLKGHRSVGGCRASIYNACPMAAVTDLTAFMADFAAKKG